MAAFDVFTLGPAQAPYAWTFGGAAPVARVRPGTVLELYTEDCFDGKVRGVNDLASQVCDFPFFNPQTGPFYIEGAEPGDTLAVHFVSIEPARDWAASTTFPLFGALTSTHTTATLQPPLPELVWLWALDRERRICTFQGRESDVTVELPMDPMHGTVGVAPPNLEVRSSLIPDAHGGNLDTPEMRAGVTCYLGVNVEGALFSLGDGHARQGEGETCGVAVETAMNTVVIVDVLKGVPTPWPRLESDTHVMSTNCSPRPSSHPSATYATATTPRSRRSARPGSPAAAAPATRMLASVPKPRPTSPANSQPTRHTQRYAAHRHHRSTRRPIHSPETCPTHLSHSATRAATIMVNPSSE